ALSTTIVDATKGARPNARVFSIIAGIVQISGITIRNGGSTNLGFGGGGIYNSSTLTLTDSLVTGNSANIANAFEGTGGGGITNVGTMTLINSTVRRNGVNGTIDVFMGSVSVGGGVGNKGTMTLINSTVSGNNAGGTNLAQAGGGINNTGSMTLIDSTVSGNSATSTLTPVQGVQFGTAGGGIFN